MPSNIIEERFLFWSFNHFIFGPNLKFSYNNIVFSSFVLVITIHEPVDLNKVIMLSLKLAHIHCKSWTLETTTRLL